MITYNNISDLKKMSELQQKDLIGTKQMSHSISMVSSIPIVLREVTDENSLSPICVSNSILVNAGIDDNYTKMTIQECSSCGSKEFNRKDGFKKCVYCGSEYEGV